MRQWSVARVESFLAFRRNFNASINGSRLLLAAQCIGFSGFNSTEAIRLSAASSSENFANCQMTTKINPSCASLKDLHLLNQAFLQGLVAIEVKDSRTKEAYRATPFATLLRKHIPTKSEMVKNADGYPCLDGWKISHILHAAQDIYDKWGINMSQLHNEEVFCHNAIIMNKLYVSTLTWRIKFNQSTVWTYIKISKPYKTFRQDY